jgi:hypothetical protein
LRTKLGEAFHQFRIGVITNAHHRDSLSQWRPTISDPNSLSKV